MSIYKYIKTSFGITVEHQLILCAPPRCDICHKLIISIPPVQFDCEDLRYRKPHIIFTNVVLQNTHRTVISLPKPQQNVTAHMSTLI